MSASPVKTVGLPTSRRYHSHFRVVCLLQRFEKKNVFHCIIKCPFDLICTLGFQVEQHKMILVKGDKSGMI